MRILLTRLSSLGDIVHTLPLAAALRASGHIVAWVVEPEYIPLLAGGSGIDRIVTAPTRRWRTGPFEPSTLLGIRTTRDEIRKFGPDAALDPQGLVKSAVWGWLSGTGRRIGFARGWRREASAGLFYSETVQPPPEARHVIDLNLSLLTAFAIEPPWGGQPDARSLLARPRPAGSGEDEAPVVLLPGTARRHKTWPAARFVDLARRCASEGIPVVVAWGPGEKDVADVVARAAGPGVETAPPTTLVELAGVLAGSAAVVGGDTGPLHLAAALGVPAVGIYLATDPARNGPRGSLVRVARDPADAAGPSAEAVMAALVDLLREASG
ncbi:MAG: lipopolysaccharide heptosyltransferase I [Acidobacteria bacterium]|nr:lipopolysaccharide heptosyltransferase I [Acidobacteriota bacterium]